MRQPIVEESASTRSSVAVTAALEDALRGHYRQPCRIAELRRNVSEYSTSFTIEDLDVTLADGRQLQLVLKDLSWQSLIGDAQRIRPRFLFNPRREIAVYEHVLHRLHLGTPAFFGALIDETSDRYWLFLERVQSAKLCHIGDFGAWENVARWLGRFHASHAGTMADGKVPALSFTADVCRTWAARASAYLERSVTRAPKQQEDVARLEERYKDTISRLIALPSTLIHGEFYASNILVDESVTDETSRVCPIDWEMVAVGPALIDLAALTSGNWSEDRRMAMTTAYRASLAEFGALVMPVDEMLHALDYCRLHLAMQWLGWAMDWQAPPDQAQDWLSEALALVEKIDR